MLDVYISQLCIYFMLHIYPLQHQVMKYKRLYYMCYRSELLFSDQLFQKKNTPYGNVF